MSKKTEVSILPLDQLLTLDTKRLLALKKTVLAKKSAIYSRNQKKTEGINHPFDLPLNILLKEREEFKMLEKYHQQIVNILGTRENI